MYVAGAMVFLMDWPDNSKPWEAAVGIGLCLGFALGIKPTGGFMAAGVGLSMVLLAVKGSASRRHAAMRSIAGMVLVMGVSGGIWYLRTYMLTGNPVFPFLNGIFRSPLWYIRNEAFNYSAFGFGGLPWVYVRLPWDLTFTSSQFVEAPNGGLGTSLPGSDPAVGFLSRRLGRIWAVGLAVLGFSILWMFAVQYLRYWIPALPGCAILAGSAWIGLWEFARAKAPRVAACVPGVLLALAALNLPLLLVQQRSIDTRIPFPVVLGKVSEHDYRARENALLRDLRACQ